MKEYIKGNYKKAIFKSDKGFVIGLFKIKDTNSEAMKDFVNKTVTFTGTFADLNEDDSYILYGEAVRHPRYGFQYQVNEYERVKPEDKDGIVEFLSSDLFPGIGEKLATNIVKELGINALDIISKDPSCLANIPKLTPKKASTIYSNLKRYEESHNIITTLTEMGFAIKDCMSIYNTFKAATLNIINANIYTIINNVEDISFNKVDAIALRNNIELDNPNRVKAAILHAVGNITFKNGDTYVEYADIIKESQRIIRTKIDSEKFESYLEELVNTCFLYKYNDVYYLTDIFKAEDYVANKIITLASREKTDYKDKLDNFLEYMESYTRIKYNDKQKEAIIKSLENHISIITGGPGTGKTTIIKAIVEIYGQIHNYGYDELTEAVTLLAPTGRASKRMSESCNLPASTIHRFLKWNKDNNEFEVNEENPNNSKLIIVDEVSMIDISLLSSLFKGLTDDIKIIFVGDYNQLPSVGPGQVLKDLIESNIIDTVHLDLLYRQDEDSYINKLAIEIKEETLSENFTDTRSDYMFLKCSSQSLRNNLKNICKQVIDKGYNYKKVQLMAPMYGGENGIDNLNMELQDVFNPKSNSKNEFVYGDVIYRENDKVLQLVNNPDDNVYNGDIGVITAIVDKENTKSGKDEITIDFDGTEVTYQYKDFNKFKHAFIISIHKSQGSEFEMVILPICMSYRRMLYRKLIYTAVTRAKRKLILIGEPEAFMCSVKNNNEYIRKTSLKERINSLLYNK